MIIIDLIAAAFGFSLIILSMGYLSSRDYRAGKSVGFLFYFLMGFISIMNAYDSGEMYLRYPCLMYVNQPIELFLGPLAYLYLVTRIRGKITIDIVTILLFIPGIFGLIWFIPFFMQEPAVKLASIGFINTPQPARTVFLLIMYSAAPLLISGLLLSALYTYKALGRKSLAHLIRMRVLLFNGIIWISITVLAYILTLLNNWRGIVIIFIAIDIILIILYHLDMRYSGFFDLFTRELREIRYRRSQINGLDTNAVVNRLSELMEYEKLFLDESLSLGSLSERLGITSHQLSEILNNALRMNFKTFVNSYRITEAKRMITGRKEENILRIAFECGFSSKTVFNTTFSRIVGKTPTEFRNDIFKTGKHQ